DARGATAQAILARSVVHFPDVLDDAGYGLTDLAQQALYRSIVSIPMLREGVPIGAITISSAEPAKFSERQIGMLQTFADQAVIAIENTRLFNELERRNRDITEALEQQTATSEILRITSQSQRDVQPVFQTIAANARKLCEANFAAIYKFDGELMHIAALDGYRPEELAELHRAFPMPARPNTASGRAILTSAVSYIPDALADADYGLEAVVRMAGFHSVVAVPMLRDGKPIGTITLAGGKPAMFTERQRAMLETFADQAVIAIENTRLFNELERRNRDLIESLEQQTATSEILRVTSQSQSDVQPVFKTIAANARQLLGAAFGSVF